METFTASEFLSRLEANSLEDPAPLDLVGLARHDGAAGDSIAFSPNADCDRWHAIPAKMVQEVQLLHTVICRDHTHALVRLTLKRPLDEDVSACTFYDLLLDMRRGHKRAMAAKSMADRSNNGLHGKTTAAQPSTLRSPCIIFHGMEGLYVCCPPEEGIGPYSCTGMV